ncbi:hypothetical protein H2274_07195 [Campylobacter sp. W0049]|uniref:YopX family protein n=1 Tax=Campylobacter molothri TaxID=1032242 RepID=UPI00301D4193|nr:hypothetical protein [Campylobacter sp. W0049]
MKLSDFDFRVWNFKQKIYRESTIVDNFLCLPSIVKHKNFKNIVFIEFIINLVKNEKIDILKSSSFINEEGKEEKKEEYELELWTGFYDKNGKKIFENDIVEYQENEALIIKYIKGTFYACQDYEKFMKKYKCQDNKDTEKFWLEEAYKINNLKTDDNNFIARFEIIGNIHENSDLLADKD